MKKFIAFIFCGITFTFIANAESINIDWIVDNETYTTTTCNIGDDLILPAAPTKYGYTFQGWLTYIPIEYIESTGTQWIDTLIAVNTLTNPTIETKFQMTKDNTDVDWFGTQSNGSNTIIYDVEVHPNRAVAYIRWGTTAGMSLQFVDNKSAMDLRFISEPHTLKMMGGKNLEIFVDNELVAVGTGTGTFVNSQHLNISRGRYVASARWYNFIISNDNTVLFNGIPVLDPNWVPCMYDRVTDTCFYNSGTGDFIAGPLIGE